MKIVVLSIPGPPKVLKTIRVASANKRNRQWNIQDNWNVPCDFSRYFHVKAVALYHQNYIVRL